MPCGVWLSDAWAWNNTPIKKGVTGCGTCELSQYPQLREILKSNLISNPHQGMYDGEAFALKSDTQVIYVIAIDD